jgi:hypothetical protein
VVGNDGCMSGHPVVTELQADPSSSGRRSSARLWIIVAVVTVLVILGVVTAVVLVADSAAIHDGPGTVTFIWTPISHTYSAQTGNPPPQPFTADINGHIVIGTASSILSQSSISSRLGTPGASGSVPAFRYTGQLAGRSFALVLSFQLLSVNPLNSSSAPSPRFRITVVGSYGGMPVTATVGVPETGPTTGHPAHLTGNIGHWKVSADIPRSTGTSTRQSATVHYSVSG